MKIRLIFILVLLLPILFAGCSSSNDPAPVNESNWDEMKWDQGKWG